MTFIFSEFLSLQNSLILAIIRTIFSPILIADNKLDNMSYAASMCKSASIIYRAFYSHRNPEIWFLPFHSSMLFIFASLLSLWLPSILAVCDSRHTTKSINLKSINIFIYSVNVFRLSCDQMLKKSSL